MEREKLEKVIEYFVNTLSKKTLREMVYEQFVNLLWNDEELLINILESDSKKSIEQLLKESTGGHDGN